jgi:L-fuconolactonase
MSRLVDSHVHLWKLERGDYGWLNPSAGVLYRDYEMEQLKPLLLDYDVEGIVVVQAAPTLQETAYMLQLAERHREIIGVVGWADLASEQAESTIQSLAGQRKLAGIRLDSRFVADYRGGKEQLLHERLRCCVDRGLSIDWLVNGDQLDVVRSCLAHVPDMTAVINHLGSPRLTEEDFQSWHDQMERLASCAHVMVKLSGMITQGDREQTDRHMAYVHALCKLFGSRRLMFGSDWPVALLGGSYGDAIAYIDKLLPPQWGEAELIAVRKHNAARIYGRSLDR